MVLFILNSLPHSKILIFMVFISVNIPLLQAQNYIQVLSEEAIIFTDSTLSSINRLQAQKGEVYKLKKYHSEFVAIEMFSDELRYLKRDGINLVFEWQDDFKDFSVEPKLCEEIQSVRTEIEQKALSTGLDNLKKLAAYENFLFDKYMLNLFRKHKITHINNSIFVGCINDSLLGPIEF